MTSLLVSVTQNTNLNKERYDSLYENEYHYRIERKNDVQIGQLEF